MNNYTFSIVGSYSSNIVTKALENADISFSMTRDRYEIFRFEVNREDRAAAIAAVQKAMEVDLDKYTI